MHGDKEHAAAIKLLRAKHSQYRKMKLEARPVIEIRVKRVVGWEAKKDFCNEILLLETCAIARYNVVKFSEGIENRRSMDNPKSPFSLAEYFAGIGLVRIGLEPYGWQVAFANDISGKKYEMYKAFFPDADKHYIVKDIFDIDPSSVPLTSLATCSFPCIDLSLAGNMRGIHGKHSSAFWGFVRILRAQGESAPPLVLVENVTGWLHSNKGDDFRATVEVLNELGYTCDVFILNALSFTPQSRPRVFLIGTRLPVLQDGLESILQRPESLLSVTLKKSLVVNQDLRWFYSHLPEPPSFFRRGLTNIVEDLDDLDNRWWTEKEVKRHLEMMEDSHRKRVKQLMKSKQMEYRTFFRRRREGKQRAEVRHDDLSGCLRTAIGGSGKQFLIKAGRGMIKMRAMTPREYARLQGVPDKYPITVDGVQALTGFGDAVCVPAISWIARYALNPLIQTYSYEQVFA